jgi:hypothetical protein
VNPKKAKDLLPAIAGNNGAELVLLQHICSFYWGKVREILTTTPESTVRVLNLGAFERKHWRIEKYLSRLYAVYNKIMDSGREDHRKQLLQDISLLQAMKAFQIEEEGRKHEKTIIRHEYHQNLEKQEPDH